MIPAKYRAFIVENNLIYKAIANPADTHMRQLFEIWVTCVEPGKKDDFHCNICLSNILANYREIEQTLVQLVKEDKLIDL